ncbi:hypothetical protein B9T62_27360 [Paenibacillus donghaensis]|uniref:Uncharacterized protein n=1 Tax=Paenibacillus donghaensis TaxID=414771 RepID=A0A2Z2KL71_9BACL|nr:hypothetical protein B9T62_27360 [Paenibacillus donghaensis]
MVLLFRTLPSVRRFERAEPKHVVLNRIKLQALVFLLSILGKLERLEKLDAKVHLISAGSDDIGQISANMQLITSKLLVQRSESEIKCIMALICFKTGKIGELDADSQLIP